MVKPEYENILSELMNTTMTVSELSDAQCRLILRYLILKLRFKF